jgi:hypothetical protein
MNTLLARQLQDVLADAAPTPRLRCERQLRVSAGTLLRARPSEIGATTSIGVLGRDDVEAFLALVADVAEEFGVEARATIRGTTYSVRFTRC